MGKKLKSRINKNSPNCITFQLVHVSKNDLNGEGRTVRQILERKIPLNALRKKKYVKDIPQHLQDIISYDVDNDKLDDVVNDETLSKTFASKLSLNDPYAYLDGDCYFPKDGYDYDQHLASVSHNFEKFVPNVSPDSKNDVCADYVNRSIINKDDENEVLAALKEADNYEELNDDFVQVAQTDKYGNICVIDESSILFHPDKKLSSEEYKLNINASMRIGKDNVFEQRFENILEEYADSEVNNGDIFKDCEDNNRTQIILNNIIEEDAGNVYGYFWDKKKNLEILNPLSESEINHMKSILNCFYESDECEDIYVNDDENLWDCETVLSLKTRTSNLPHKITVPKILKPVIQAKTCGPLGRTCKQQNVFKKIPDYDIQVFPKIDVTRRKGESTESRKKRKDNVKNMKRISRQIRKSNIQIFKEERSKMKLLAGAKNPYDLKPGTKYFRL